MLVSGHKIKTPDGFVDVVCVVDPFRDGKLIVPAEQVEWLAEKIKSTATRLKLEVTTG